MAPRAGLLSKAQWARLSDYPRQSRRSLQSGSVEEMVYSFGPFRYDAGQRLLFREDTLVPLVPKAVDTLHVLLERRGRIVDKSELMKLVWPDTTVEEGGLARNISLLRKALEDEAEAYVETIPRRGYRFVADVAEVQPPVEAPPPRRRWRWLWTAVPPVILAMLGALIYWQFYTPSRYLRHRSGDAAMAVVPFECVTPEPQCPVFAQAITGLLAADLSQLDWVEVVSPGTVRRHQHLGISMGLMGRLLALDALLEGSVQPLDGRIRITANLVDVHTGKLIWAESYEYPVGDSGAIQKETARQISATVGAHLAIQQPFQKRR